MEEDFFTIMFTGIVCCVLALVYLVSRTEFSVKQKISILVSFVILPFLAAIIWLVYYFVFVKKKSVSTIQR